MKTVQTRSESRTGLSSGGRLLLCATIAGMGFTGFATFALEAANAVQHLPAKAVIRFAATSTLHDFGGQLSAQPFTLIISNGTWSASADVLAGQMATENAKRDRNMHQMLG